MEHLTSRIVGEVVARKLETAGISLRDAALRAGIPLTTLHRRVRGSAFTTDELVALAALLDTTASALIAEAEAVA